MFCFAQTTNPEYDQALAESLGADQYGMKSFVLVILKTGETQMDDKDKVNELFKGHMANISKLVEDGKLIVAGPLGKNDLSYRGIFILDVKTIDEAKVLVDTDPAVISGLLAADYFPWYGSAALPVYLDTAKKITKENH
jgi:uncharacterized protein YciI